MGKSPAYSVATSLISVRSEIAGTIRIRSIAQRSLLTRTCKWLATSWWCEPNEVAAPGKKEVALEAIRMGTIVQFPLRGRGLLMQLARELETCVAKLDDHDPVLLTVVIGPQLRLLIDSTAYVDIRDHQLPYCVVLGDGLTARITLETADFTEVRPFVSQYLILTRGQAHHAGGRA